MSVVYQLGPNLESDFRTVILNEDDTEFVRSAVGVTGWRYRSRDESFSHVDKGEKLEITDIKTSTFVIQCLLKRSEVSNRLVAAHRRTFERIQEYQLPMMGPTEYANTLASIELHEAIVVTAGLVIDDILTSQTNERT